MFRSQGADNYDAKSEKVILVIGACGLDRLLAVPSYPIADSKVRTTSYDESGGGNAANSATAMALLSGASMFRNGSIIVKLCTKIGDDFIGRQLIDEMEKCGVDLSSPLFKVGEIGSTTGLTNIIVSETEHTRTCIHTPGTCGELTPHDIHEVNLDEVFRNVIHFHTDGRHTEASLLLAKEAKRRRITVSIDVEKDRNSKALDCLLEVADLVFTNSNQIEAYLFRLTRQFEQEVGLERLKEANIIAPGSSSMTDLDMDLYAQIIKPSAYFTRRYGQEGKLIVITKGGHGACSILSTKITESVLTDEQGAISNQIEISKDDVAVVRVLETITERFSHSSNLRRRSTSYDVSTAGVLTDVKVVDTTGAGDAFVGGYLLARIVLGLQYVSCLRFACWVGGRKVQGVGARSALPTAVDVDEVLGRTTPEVETSLVKLLSSFKIRPCPGDASVPLVESWESFEQSY